ncbi:MAG: hypothetical protein KDJ74_17850, partial [Notoacmeibacter sp.]|nr:hypothetical protein [Notoacmeibacter sp.]
IDDLPLDADAHTAARTLLTGRQGSGRAGAFAFLPAWSKLDGSRLVLMLSAAIDPAGWVLQAITLGWRTDVGDQFARAFSLTNAEIDILESIVRGRSLQDFATQRGRSIATVRTQAKSLLRKTEASSQLELVRMFSAMSLALGSARAPVSSGQVFFVPAEGGRRIELACWGPENGRPVLLVHGLVTGIEPPEGALAGLEALNIRLVAPWRASFAGTTAAGGGHGEARRQATADLLRVMDHLGIGQAMLLARDSGLLYAGHAALALPERITGIVSVTSNLPWRSARQLEGIAKLQRMFAYSARYFPLALPVLARGAMELVHNGKLDQLLENLFGAVSADRAAIAGNHVRTTLQHGFEATFRQGTKAYETDARLTALDWSAGSLDGLKVPVRLLHGALDRVTLIRDVHELAALHPGMEVETVANAGQLLWYTHWDRVLGSVSAFLDETSRAA